MPTLRSRPSTRGCSPLRYRARGEKQWHDAQTENISRSGVLFRTQGVLDIATEVEMTFVLPGLEGAPAIVCRGRVVRTVYELCLFRALRGCG